MNRIPSVGRIVHVLVDPRSNNGALIAPAVITRYWGYDTASGTGSHTINYRLLLDHKSNDPDLQEWRTSGKLFRDEDAARAHIERVIVMPKSVGESDQDYLKMLDMRRTVQLNAGMLAFWPPVQG